MLQRAFNIDVTGHGTYELWRFSQPEEMFIELLEFEVPASGLLRVWVNGEPKVHFDARYMSLRALPLNAAIPPGADVRIELTTGQCRLVGKIQLKPALQVVLGVALAVFGLEPDFDRGKLRKAYRKLVVANHPDRGGDPEKMKGINALHQLLLESLASREKEAA